MLHEVATALSTIPAEKSLGGRVPVGENDVRLRALLDTLRPVR